MLRSLILLALGFSFLLAIFPFTSWIPILMEKNHPFLTGFVLNSYLLGVLLFGLRFILEAGWFNQAISIQGPLQLAGVIMLGFGGGLAVVSKHLGRLMAAVVISGIGRALLAVSLFITGFPIFFGMIIIQSLALGGYSLSLTYLDQVTSKLNYDSVTGAARQWPMISSGILGSVFTLAGLPLLAGFPLYWMLGMSLENFPFWINLWNVLGSIGLILGGIRALVVLTKDSGEEVVLIVGNPFYRSLVLVSTGILLLFGLFPHLLFEIGMGMTAILLGS
jgi:NADH:ubiquinone oxidoreductase subunit 2 (subunit N)